MGRKKSSARHPPPKGSKAHHDNPKDEAHVEALVEANPLSSSSSPSPSPSPSINSKPKPLSSISQSVTSHWDESRKKYYYHNLETDEVSWTMPPEQLLPPSSSPELSPSPPSHDNDDHSKDVTDSWMAYWSTPHSRW